MKPRSIVFDLFGDYTRYHGGEIRLRALTTLLECFDIGESTVRVVMARLRREGWFDTRREGRETVYALNDRSWRLLDEGRPRIFERSREAWDRRWYMVIYAVPETERALREELRKELSWLGFGPLASSTWISPHNRLTEVEEHFADRPGLRLDLLRCQSSGLSRDREMATRCWDLESLNAEYAEWLRERRPRMASYRRGQVSDKQALVERMELTHSYRMFPFSDPDLPEELLPAGWKGHEAHELFIEAHDLLKDPAERFYSGVTAEGERVA